VSRYLYVYIGYCTLSRVQCQTQNESAGMPLVLPHRLRQIRESKGLSQRELGRLCGLGANQVNRYEGGVSEPTVQTLKAIASHLEITTDYLLGLTDNIENNSLPVPIEPDERELLDTYRNQGWSGVVRLGAERMTK